jgi:hypothetical protein
MKAKEVAERLMKYPDADVLLRVGSDWVEVCNVGSTGQHRNAVTFEVVNPHLPGVIVVEPDVQP